MRERLSWLVAVTLPSLGGAVEGAKTQIESGVQAASDLGASVSGQAARSISGLPEIVSEAWHRLAWPTFGSSRLSSLSSLSWPFGSDPVAALSSCPPLVEPTAPAASLAAATSAEWGSAVGNSGLTWDLFFLNTDHDWSDEVDMGGLVRFLRGRYPDKTAANVSADTRLPADTVKKWLALVAAPNGRAMLVLACVYGPEVLVALLRRPPGWLVQSARAAEQSRLEAELAALIAKLAGGPR